jgi:hypothetical protein
MAPRRCGRISTATSPEQERRLFYEPLHVCSRSCVSSHHHFQNSDIVFLIRSLSLLCPRTFSIAIGERQTLSTQCSVGLGPSLMRHIPDSHAGTTPSRAFARPPGMDAGANVPTFKKGGEV